MSFIPEYVSVSDSASAKAGTSLAVTPSTAALHTLPHKRTPGAVWQPDSLSQALSPYALPGAVCG